MVEMKKNIREITKVGMIPSAELVFVVKKTNIAANDIDVSERSSMLLEIAKYSSFSIDRILKKTAVYYFSISAGISKSSELEDTDSCWAGQ